LFNPFGPTRAIDISLCITRNESKRLDSKSSNDASKVIIMPISMPNRRDRGGGHFLQDESNGPVDSPALEPTSHHPVANGVVIAVPINQTSFMAKAPLNMTEGAQNAGIDTLTLTATVHNRHCQWRRLTSKSPGATFKLRQRSTKQGF
jgi:hypothetical protein